MKPFIKGFVLSLPILSLMFYVSTHPPSLETVHQWEMQHRRDSVVVDEFLTSLERVPYGLL